MKRSRFTIKVGACCCSGETKYSDNGLTNAGNGSQSSGPNSYRYSFVFTVFMHV